MILQRDVRLLTPINKFGCYYTCIPFIANKYTNCPIDTDALNDGYEDNVHAGWMDEDCFVLNPEKIFHYFGLAVKYYNCFSAPNYPTAENEVEILYFELKRMNKPTWPHFVVGDGFGHVAYDPYGVSRCVAEGVLKSKRIFTLL